MIKIVLISFIYLTFLYGYSETKENDKQLFEKFKIAAESGNMYAQYSIADMFRIGEGTEKFSTPKVKTISNFL